MAEKTKPGLASGAWFAIALSVVVLGLGVLALIGRRRSASRVRAMADEVRADIVKLRAEAAARPRAALFTPVVPGNAADDYALISWVTGPPLTWDRTAAPPLPGLLKVEDPEAGNLATLGRSIRERLEARRGFAAGVVGAKEAKPLSAKDVMLLERFVPLLSAVRAGVHREQLDWRVQYEAGFAAEILNITGGMAMAWVGADEAVEIGGADGVERALEVVRFGHDLSEAPLLIMAAVGSNAQSAGAEALELLLVTEQLPADTLRRIVEVLHGAQIIDVAWTLRGERVLAEASLATWCKVPLDGVQRELALGYVTGPEVLRKLRELVSPGRRARAWMDYREDVTLVAASIAASPHAITPGEQRLYDRLTHDSGVVGMMMPNFRHLAESVANQNEHHRRLRYAAAARLMEVEAGSLPADAEGLVSLARDFDALKGSGTVVIERDGETLVIRAAPEGHDVRLPPLR